MGFLKKNASSYIGRRRITIKVPNATSPDSIIMPHSDRVGMACAFVAATLRVMVFVSTF